MVLSYVFKFPSLTFISTVPKCFTNMNSPFTACLCNELVLFYLCFTAGILRYKEGRSEVATNFGRPFEPLWTQFSTVLRI